MWKMYKKSIDSFGRWTLMQGPRGPFYRVHRQLQFCCTVSSAASFVCDLCRPESCYLILNLFPLLPPLPFPAPQMCCSSQESISFSALAHHVRFQALLMTLVLLVCSDQFCNLGP